MNYSGAAFLRMLPPHPERSPPLTQLGATEVGMGTGATGRVPATEAGCTVREGAG